MTARRPCQVVCRHASAPQMLDERRLQGDRGVIAGDGDRPNLRDRRERGVVGIGAFTHHRNAPCLERILRQRRNVAAAHEYDRAAVLQHARVRFGDHLKSFHERRYVTLAAHGRSTHADVHQR